MNKIDISEFITLFKTINISFLLFAIALVGVQLSLLSFRWFMVNKQINVKISFSNTLAFTFIGQFFNQILPSSIGGDAVKILALSKCGFSLSKSTSSVFCDRFVGLIVLILSIFFALIIIPENLNLHLSDINFFIYTSIIFVFIFFFVLRKYIKHISNIFKKNKLFKSILLIIDDFFFLFSSLNNITKIFFLSLIIQLITVYVFYIISFSISSVVSFKIYFILIPVVTLISMIPISFAGWGLREVALVVAFDFAGLNESHAVTISILFGLIQIIWAFPGLFFITTKKNLI
jgi:uncharacterized protein (TIRG00374 family)